MADVAKFDLTQGVTNIGVLISGLTDGSASGTIPMENGKDAYAVLMVLNLDTSAATITLKEATNGGFRAPLGDLEIALAASTLYFINLNDSSRYKNLPDQDIDYTMTSEGTIGTIQLGMVQLGPQTP
jgi:hypothetical protein